jgi:hypothetical protein
MTGIYDWEFDGSVDFAPLPYRKSKYKNCKKLGEQIKDEETALEYLDAFHYVDYLAENHMNEIPCYNELVAYEEMALSMLKSKEALWKWIVYPAQHKIWKQSFDNLRAEEKKILNKEYDISVEEYIQKVKDFNTKVKEKNQENQIEYGVRHTHNLFWVRDMMLKHDMRKALMPFPKDFNEKIDYLELYGVSRKEDWYRL